MLRTLRGPLGWALTAVMVFAACGGGTGAPPQGGATATTDPGPRLGSINRPIVLAFTPSQDVQRLTTSGNAIKAELEKATGLAWKVSIPNSYAAQIESMCANQTDIAFIAPLQMTLVLDKNCGTPVLAALRTDPDSRQLSPTYYSQILVKSDSGINDIAGLKGKTFAFADALSASGYVFPTLTVKNKTGQDPKTFFSSTIFAGGHDKVALAVYSGQVAGGATFIDVRTSAGMPADIMQKTKLIDKAGPIPNDGVALRKGFPDELGKQVVKSLVDYGKTDAGKAAFLSLFSWNGMQEVDAKFYDPMREAAKLAGIDVAAEAAKTARPVATPAPSPSRAP
jgi:phosphonate transport system substrate-binding protein